MAGLLDANKAAPEAAQAAPQGGAPKKPGNPTLQAIQSGIEAKVRPEDKRNFNAMVTAGMAVMFSATTGKRIMDKLASTQDIVGDVAKGTANIVALVFNDVTAKMPPPQKQQIMVAAFPASVILMCQALDTYEQISGKQVDEQAAAAAQSATAKEMMAKFELTPDKVKQAVASKGQPQAQPAAQPAQAAPMQGA